MKHTDGGQRLHAELYWAAVSKHSGVTTALRDFPLVFPARLFASMHVRAACVRVHVRVYVKGIYIRRSADESEPSNTTSQQSVFQRVFVRPMEMRLLRCQTLVIFSNYIK